MAAGVGGLALILATGRWPGLWALACLAAWGGVAAARLAWQILRQQAQQGEPLLLGDQLLDWYCQGFWCQGIGSQGTGWLPEEMLQRTVKPYQ